MSTQFDLFGGTYEYPEPKQPSPTHAERFNDYDGFVDKFKPKKTSDDCFTPQPVYDAVRDWVSENIMPLDGVEVVRPFYPGGDYINADYPQGCVVLDNPPFSILAKIRRFYHSRGIRYFLFAPSLTMANSARELPATYLVCGADITYENGAVVKTSFVTNLDCGGTLIWCAGSLHKAVEAANDRVQAEKRRAKELPVYVYPANVVSPAILQRVATRGVDFRVAASEAAAVTGLDAQREAGKAIFGGGWLISERAAAERAAARAKTVWELSPRELAIIRELSNNQQ